MTSRRGRASTVVACAFLTLGGLSACGSPSALDRVPEDQRDQLVAAWEARIKATDTAQIPVEERNARVTALYEACAKLDRSVPLAAAVAETCQPTAISAKLSAVLAERCASPSTSCVRALDRVAQTTEELATVAAGLSEAATKTITEPACRAEFATTEAQLKGYADLTQAYRVLALGIERKDEEISGLGQRRVDDARALITPSGSVDQRLERFRNACGVGT